MRGEGRSFLNMDFRALEEAAIKLAFSDVRNLEFLKRVSKSAYYAVMYGTPYRTVIREYVEERIDEEGCGAVMCVALGRDRHED